MALAGRKPRLVAVCLACSAVVGLVYLTAFAVPARAGLESVGHFAGSAAPLTKQQILEDEEIRLGGVGGMAVNYTGAGGVAPGTVYAVGFQNSADSWVSVFIPKPGGGLVFKRSWFVSPVADPLYDHCGPSLATACQPRVEGLAGLVDIDVNQATGNVYVLNAQNRQAGRDMVIEYTPDGEAEITRFAEIAPSGKTTAETPEQIHSSGEGGLAVNSAGEVYVYDLSGAGDSYHRLMKFRPKTPGVFTEYEYAGMSEDIAPGIVGQGLRDAREPVLDAAGNIYTVAGASGTHIEEYDPSSPGAGPVCSFNFAPTKITGVTVDPVSGEPFFFSYSQPKHIYRLGPCNEATGRFEGPIGEEIVEELVVAPERDNIWGLAYDPVAKFTPTRPAGVLYAGAPGPVPTLGLGVGEPGQSSLGYIFAPAEENPPVVKSQSVSKVTATSAELQGVIDPEGFKTRYLFEYLTEQAYEDAGESFTGAAQAPLGEAFLSGNEATASVGVTLTGLEPDTEYRYRAVAISHCAAGKPEKACETDAPAARLHTYPAAGAGPPDGRVYELVSPAEKNGGQVFPADPRFSAGCGLANDCKPGSQYIHWPMQSSPDGNLIAYEGSGFVPGVGAAIENAYIARRDSNLGWQSLNPSPPLLLSGGGGRGYMAYDRDLSRAVVAQAHPTLSPAAPPEYENLYSQPMSNPLTLAPLLSTPPPNRPASGTGSFRSTFVGASSDLSRVFFEANDVLTAEVPGIAPEPENGGPNKFNIYEWEAATGQLRLVNVLPGNATAEAGAQIGVASTNAVSADGSRVFFSDEAGQVYVREGAAATEEIPDPGKFLSASRDGSRVLLTNGHFFDLESGVVSDLTVGKADFEGIAGQSDDLSRVYFVDSAVLTGEETNSEGAKAQAGKPNLYAWSEEGPMTHFVATLVANDNSGNNLVRSQSWASLPSQRTAEASPGGRFLAFLSQARLTGFDNLCESSVGGKEEEGACAKVFLYDSLTGQLVCASCNRTGEASQGWSILRRIPGSASLPQPRYLTDSGRLYFDSQEALSQFDTNDGVEDVYQFQAQGAGGCQREGGCVALISSGRDDIDSNLVAVDPTGKNVFFTSRERLNVADTDELMDLYDAREGGGFPFESQLPKGPCQGEGCQMPAPAPAGPPPASENPGGEGENAKPVKCKKGQVKKNNKCVKKHKPKKKGGKNKKRAAKSKRGGAK